MNRTWGLIVVVVSISLVGCGKCEECELNNSSETICETEFDNTDQYQDAIADREAAGATCTSKGGF
ncbi:MAG: hypothetical protein K9J17_11130 [Flavobacteriales bacterium]|nr:hypothetical protein [Flavobacteriales bacterium]